MCFLCDCVAIEFQLFFCRLTLSLPSDDKKLTTGITNSYKTGQAAESILVVQGVQTDGTVKIKVGSDHASSASASKALEYYCKFL